MESDTLYELLGVPNDAATEEIRSAYRRLSKTFHPDRGGTAAFFRQLQDAHDTLTNAELRAEYDRSLRISGTTPPPQQEESGPSQQGESQHHSESTGGPSQSHAESPPGHSQNPPAYRRLFNSWSRGIEWIATKTGRRGRSRQSVVVAAWILSIIVVLVWLDFLIIHDWFAIILVALAVFAWRRFSAKRRAATAHQNAANLAAARARAAKEAAERQRTERAATKERVRAAKEAAARERAAKAERDQAAWEKTARERATQAQEDGRYEAEYEAREAHRQEDIARSAAESGDLDFILALSPTQFEYTMAAMLRMLGMTNVHRVGGRGDLGVDITATDPSGRSMVVQCKRYARNKKIGSPDIQKFIGMAHVHHQADLKLFVTTSEYTEDARTLAIHHDIQLMNGADIENLARRQRESTRSE